MPSRRRKPSRPPQLQSAQVFRSVSEILNTFISFVSSTGSDYNNEPFALDRWVQANLLSTIDYETEERNLEFRNWFEQEVIDRVTNNAFRVFTNSMSPCPLHMDRCIDSLVFQ